MSEKILFVDDDTNLLAAYERQLRKQFTLETASGGEKGLACLQQNGPFALVVADRQMPGMDGTRFLALVRQYAPDTVRIMLTGNVDLEAAIRTVNEGGIFRFLTKPCPPKDLTKALEDGLAQYRLVVAEKELLTKTLNGSIKLLTDVLSMVDAKSFGRSQALRDALVRLAPKLELPNAWEIHLAVMLAPIGLVTLPAELVVKSRSGTPLSEAEAQVLARVPESAARLLANIPRLGGVARMVQYQRKNFDGSGSPADTVAGDAIPLGSRLLKILVDSLDLESKGVGRREALETLQRAQGVYDPALLAAVRQHWEPTPTGTMLFKRTTRSVPLDQLAVGMVLHANVEANDGTIILPAGRQLDDIGLENIRAFAHLGTLKEPILVETADAATRA